MLNLAFRFVRKAVLSGHFIFSHVLMLDLPLDNKVQKSFIDVITIL
ncbi:hypothetical protein OIU74_029153 [Salix koriyanagi]|uniref:Uncharacterized protein n=1 Tax=Salix koriyanagi TaxID=2511006 RepID=A0A9Q0VFH1_9ROSI|nr:hypothetical protein OIU74_029153 [Salix koriyanagi]